MRLAIVFCFLLVTGVSRGQAWYQIRTLAGAGGIGDGGPAAAALFLQLNGVAVDPSGNLYLADTDAHRIRKIAPNGQVTTFAGTGKPGFSGDGGIASQAMLNFPYGLATDYGGSLYIADLGNARIRKVTPDGRIATIAGNSPETRLVSPRNVAVDGPGQVYISDFGAHRVYRLTPKGLAVVAGAGRAGNTGDGGPAEAALLHSPAGLAFDPAGNLHIGDTGNKRVRMVSLAGLISGLPASQLALPVVATGLAHTFAGDLWIPDGSGGTLMRVAPQQTASPFPFAAMDVASDFAGNVYAVRGNLVRRIAARTMATSIVAGGTPFYFSGDGGQALDARLQRPGGLAVDPATGSIYIADSGNGRIRRIAPGTGRIETVLDGFTDPRGLVWDAKQKALLIADSGSNSVWIWRPDTMLAQAVLAGGTGVAGFKGDGGPAVDAQLSGPSALTVDDRGNIWIADTGNSRVRVLDPISRTIRSVATVKGVAGIVWDSRGFVFASEPAQGRIHVVDEKGIVESMARPGIWTAPQALALDFDGISLLVLDAATHKLSRMTADGNVTVLAGTGEAGFDGDTPAPAVASRLDGPSAIVPDYANLRLLIADSNNHRIRALEYTDAGQGNVGTSGAVTLPSVALVNGASRLPVSAVAPGGLVLLSGSADLLTADAEVAFDGVVTPKLADGAEWLLQVPEEAVSRAEVELTLSKAGMVQVRQFIKVAPAAPGVFPVLVNAEDGSTNSVDSPVTRGTTLLVRMTGEGRTGLPVEVRIRDSIAQVLSQEVVSPGVLQLEVQVPGGYFPSGAFPLQVLVGNVAAQASLQVFIR